MIRPQQLHRFALTALAAATLAGCATTAPQATPPVAAAPAAAPASGPDAAAPRAAGPAAGAAPAARPPAPGTPPPFAEVTRDAKSSAGFLPLWTKDEKTWLEIPVELLNKPFFLGSSVASGLGQFPLLPGLMGGEQVVVLKRVGNNVQLVAPNRHARAPAGTPLGRAVTESYADSLLASAPLAAAPHAERKSLLVDAYALLGGDLLGIQTALEGAFRMPYSLDRGNSHIERARSTPQGTFFTLRSNYAVPKMPAPPVMAPGAPPPNPAMMPNPPRSLADARSMVVSHTLTLAPLPEQPMTPRLADQRVGYFTDAFVDHVSPTASPDRRTHYINRWRLEKKDPAAAVSEPKEPIRVVMDRNIPERWRDTVREGILLWNLAFERAGFRNAIVVEQQADDADWTTFEGTRLLAVRWFAMEGPGATAVGPSQTDPRTGEILRGASIIPDNWVRFDRGVVQDTEPRFLSGGLEAPAPRSFGDFATRYAACSFGSEGAEQAGFGLELLQLRGAVDPDGPEGQKYVRAGLRAVVVHEVGHALGLRHNFKASTGITAAQLRDPAFTAARGTSNSVMDYNPPNVPLAGEAVADYHMPGLGAYDYWAIEYGYKPLPADQEKAELGKIAARSDTDPNLAFATDEDNQLADPSINLFDLSSDPLAYAKRQIQGARELWTLTQKRTLAPDEDYTLYRRNLQRGMARIGATVPMLTKYIGGNFTSRSLAGSGKPLQVPVNATQQRAALDVLLGELFASGSFRFDPAFMARIGFDQWDRNRFVSPEYSLPGAVAGLQRGALDTLMGDTLAVRLADAETRVADPKSMLGYADIQLRLNEAVWSELRGKAGEIDSLRRNLQREHAKRLAAGLVRPASAAAADVRAAHRLVAQQLEAQLKAALAAKGWSATARAHLADSQSLLAEALRASLVKQGV
ncbi:MAG: zinc-dependent metalloprotease [Rubrivivax sp.]|nr:zinc-dependent metalloprotease [Rubrivivax sp.]